jgi:cyclohexanecarboxyl-CoA dehydrogenase
MPFQLSDDQAAFVDIAERFTRDHLTPHYLARAKTHHMDRDVMRKMGALGLIGVDLPEKYGGLGQSALTSGLITEQIAYGDFNMSYIQLLASLLGGMVAQHAQPEIANAWVPKVVAGEAVIGLGLTEPRGGSDAANLQLRAEKTDGGWLLNGEKTSMSMCEQIDVVIIFARTGDPEGRSKGVSSFLVDASSDGITKTRFDDIGTKPVGRGSMFFDDVFVPDNCLMAEQDRAFHTVMSGFDFSRAIIGLQCLAPAQASVDETWKYASEREAFGTPIVQFQGVSFPLAEAETQLTMMRHLCYATLDLRDRDEPHTSEAAMCKWYVPKTTCEILHQCLLLHGHYGYTTDLPHQQRYNDVLGLQIGDGTAQIQKLIIAREKAGRVALQYHSR